MDEKILITGATGNVGLEVLKRAGARGLRAVAGIRKEKDKAAFKGLTDEFRLLDFEDPSTFPGALEGISRVFLMRPPALSDVRKYIFPFLRLAKDKGVRHIVLLSLLGAARNPIAPHRKIEQEILRLGIPYTFLRPSFFMQNLSTTHRDEIREGVINVPAGRGRTSFIDVRDIAEAGALALAGDAHLNRAYELTGGEALDYYRVADIFTKMLGRKVAYLNPSPTKFYRAMRAKGFGRGHILVMIVLYTTARLGLAQNVTGELRSLLGREPATLEAFVRDFRECWEPGA